MVGGVHCSVSECINAHLLVTGSHHHRLPSFPAPSRLGHQLLQQTALFRVPPQLPATPRRAHCGTTRRHYPAQNLHLKPLLEPVTVDKLDQTLRRIPDNTGLGSDCVEPGVGAKHELCHVLDCIIRNGVLPWGLLYVLIALLPKDGAALGGERPIELLPIFVRILDRLFYDELSAWCDAAHGFWDRAIANSSAPRSAIHSNLMMETAHVLGISAGILFIDLQKFYDSVDMVLLMRAREVLDYPRSPLLLLVKAFLGPRTLRADGHHSNKYQCQMDWLQAHHKQTTWPEVSCIVPYRTTTVSQFVDGLKMYTEGTTRQVVYRFGQETVELFHSLGKLKVDLSPSKCGFVATTRGIALTVCSGWHEKDFGTSSTKHARDLGVDVSFCCRSVSFARKRAKRAAFETLLRNINVHVVSCSKVEPCRRVRMGIKSGAFHQRP